MVVCLHEGRKRGYTEFILAGAIGGRFDHTLSCLQCAADCALRGERAWLVDGQNRATILAPGTHHLPKMPGRKLSLLAYSPLGFGLLTGKYDASGIEGPGTPQGARIASYESVRKQRWGRPEALAAARRYNQLAREHGLTPTQLALAFCYNNWRVASTIIGVTSLAQLDEDLNAWGTTLSPELLAAIDQIRWQVGDPAI